MTLKNIGILSIIVSAFISFILSMTANMEGAELGALFNLFLPPLIGTITLIIFLTVCWLSKNKIVRIMTIVLSCMYLFYVGYVFKFREGYLPFPFNSTARENKMIFLKNKCYDNKLTELKKTNLYGIVMTAFNDTFPVLKSKKENFGVPEVVSIRIDDAIFFKKDSSECILAVLLRPKLNNFGFGNARMVRGSLKNNRWTFSINTDIIFENYYFETFKENNFESLSKLARYSVLTWGNAKQKGCEIDDKWWFSK